MESPPSLAPFRVLIAKIDRNMFQTPIHELVSINSSLFQVLLRTFLSLTCVSYVTIEDQLMCCFNSTRPQGQPFMCPTCEKCKSMSNEYTFMWSLPVSHCSVLCPTFKPVSQTVFTQLIPSFYVCFITHDIA